MLSYTVDATTYMVRDVTQDVDGVPVAVCVPDGTTSFELLVAEAGTPKETEARLALIHGCVVAIRERREKELVDEAVRELDLRMEEGR